MSLILLCSSQVNAQSKAEIKGEIVDANNQGVSFANVVLLNVKDSSLVNGTISDEKGKYILKGVDHGNYLLKISMLTYKNVVQELAVTGNLNLKPITLNESTKELDAVVVTGQKPLVVQEVDKLVFNVKDALVTTGNSGLDILSKTPGVWVDHEGNIQLNGKGGTKIMINGKMSYMSGKELSDMLDGLNASDIVSIEVMTNPSAKYSADGAAGILNIVLAKKVDTGIQGSAFVSYKKARKNNYKTGLSTNFMKGNLSGFAQFDYNTGEKLEYLNIERDAIISKDGMPDKKLAYKEYSNMYTERKRPSFRIGLDYSLTKNQDLGMMLSFNRNNSQDIFDGYSDRFLNDVLDQKIIPNNVTDNIRQNLSYNLNYQIKLDTLGKKLKFNFDYDVYASQVETKNETSFVPLPLSENRLPNKIEVARPIADNGTNLYSLGVDYEQPITKKVFLEAGLKHDFSDIHNDIKVDSLRGENWEEDQYRRNDFNYKEWVSAAYASFRIGITPKLSIQTGLRGEQTKIETRSIALNFDSVNTQNYLNFFPTFYAQYQLSKKHNLGLTYSKRVNRPSFRALNPFVNYLNPNSGQVGNPDLKPEYMNFGELKYTFARRYTFSLNYTNTEDMMAEIPVFDSDNKILIKRQNINFQDLTLSASLPFSVTKWWESYNRASVYYQAYKVDRDSNANDLETTAYFFMSNNTFILPKNFKVELTGMMLFGEAWGVFALDPIYRTSLSLDKRILKDRLNVNLAFNDLFNLSRVSGNSSYGQNSYFRQNQDQRSVKLTLRYNFKSGKEVRKRRSKSNNASQQRRAE